MSEPQHRQKASEVFAGSTPIIGRKVPSFAEAFPQIKSCRVEVTHSVRGYGEKTTSVYTHENLPGEYIDCRNSLCYNGGISIGNILRSMVSERKTEQVVNELCRGYEGSPKGRRKYRDCLSLFTVRVQITYHDSEDSSKKPT